MYRLNEDAGQMNDFPQHWINYLTTIHDNFFGRNRAGKNSKLEPLDGLNSGTFNKVLKDKNILGIVGKIDNEPIILIIRHPSYETKYLIFTPEKSFGKYHSYSPSKQYSYNDKYGSYTFKQVMGIIDDVKGDAAFSDIQLFSISTDLDRFEKMKSRSEARMVIDPLEHDAFYNDNHPTVKQREIVKKYGNIKRIKLDNEVEIARDEIKEQIIDNLDIALDKIIMNVKNGYRYTVGLPALGRELVSNLNFDKMSKLVNQYNAVSDHHYDTPQRAVRRFKNA